MKEGKSMDTTRFSHPLDLKDVKVTDAFWRREMELVRREVIPYQWEALNDRVTGAAPSFCMHNFRAAARLNAKKRAAAGAIEAEPTMRGFEQLPENGQAPDPDRFYGFVFQDSDLYKWLEAVAYSLTVHPDAALEATADEAIDLVCAAQAEDGYLDTCYLLCGGEKRFSNLRDHHELYCLGHLTEAAVAYAQATGKDKLLRAACRYADCVAAHIGPEAGKLRGYPGHEIAEMALVRLYQATGEEKYLRQAQYFVDQRGQEPNYFAEETRLNRPKAKPMTAWDKAYYQADRPVRQQTEAVGHAVRAMYLYSGVCDVARLTQDEALMSACRALWRSTVEEKMYITGGVGGTHVGEAFSRPFDLPNDTAYSETCAAIGLVFFARRMLETQADARYADVMELALYNTVLAGMALDGKSFFYVNPLAVEPKASATDARVAHVKSVRQKWFGCACCPPNLARLISSLGAYIYTQSEDTLYTHLYVSGETRAVFGGKELALRVESDLPWGDTVRLTVENETPVSCKLALRMPGWSDNPNVETDAACVLTRDGYVYFEGEWKRGDTLTLHLPKRVRVIRADDRVREDAKQVAFTYGPIVYCGEGCDNGEELHLVRVHPRQVLEEGVRVLPSTEFGHEVRVLEVPAARVQSHPRGLYSEWLPEDERPITLRLIPYYCWANRGEHEMRVWWN